jgi:ketosteroid isomerase-like protein
MKSLDPAIAAFLEAYRDCVHRKDHQALSALYAPDVLVFDLWNTGCVSGLTTWSAANQNWLESLGSDRVEVSYSQVDAERGDDLAWVHAYVHFRAVDPSGSELRRMTNRFTWCLARAGAAWLVRHQHSSLPIDSANMSAKFDF